MNRPESRLAGGMLLFVGAVAMLVSVTMVSCEEGGGSITGDGRALPPRDGGDGGAVIAVEPPGGGESAGPAPARGPADFRLSHLGPEPEMRVRLAASVDRVRLESAGGLIFSTGAMVERTGASVLRGAVDARLTERGWIISNAGGIELLCVPSIPGGGVVLVVSSADAARGEVVVNGAAYPGVMRLVPRSEARTGGARFDVVEHVALESYLPGVVAKEMFAGWPLAAYQVQAVCARTYALHERIRSGAGGASRPHFDVESTERDQAYAGATRNRLAVDAVRSTRGMVLADGELLLRAYYSSTCGGRTASAADTWPTGPGFEFNRAGPIQAARREYACQSAPLFTWSVVRERGEVVQRLRTFGERQRVMVRRIKDLWAIEPAATNPDGRPSAFRIIEPGGVWYPLSGEQLRLALNTSVPRSGEGGAGGGADLGLFIGPPAPGAAVMASAVESIEAEAVPDINRQNRVASSDIEVIGPRQGRTVTINGRGFGHGVGMCQYCAKGFADRGEDWRTIVLRFYPGARIVSGY